LNANPGIFYPQEEPVKKVFLVLGIVVLIFIPIQVVAAPSVVIPTFTITAVDRDTSVTILTSNFPSGDSFTVTMGAYGTLGIGGVLVGTQSSGSGGSFSATYTIPASLHGSNRIAIRLESPTSGYYSYNWFWNNDYPSSGSPSPSPSSTPATGWGWPPAGSNTIPSTTIKNVVTDTSVKVKGSNFTTNDSYNVYIGAIGTKGVGGTLVGTQATNGTGTFTETYSIPAAYHGSEKLAIRWESPASGFYAYDWFVNDASAPSSPSSPPSGPGTIPTFTITAVDEDNTVKISGINFTTNDTYTVLMGDYGTLGIGGIVAGSQATGASGSFTGTYTIPASLHGNDRIAIRLESDTTAYYSYNWFWNSDYP
jgi:hypothetical protein